MESSVTRKKKALALQVTKHPHTWVPLDHYWAGTEGSRIMIACHCGAYKFIDAIELEEATQLVTGEKKRKCI